MNENIHGETTASEPQDRVTELRQELLCCLTSKPRNFSHEREYPRRKNRF